MFGVATTMTREPKLEHQEFIAIVAEKAPWIFDPVDLRRRMLEAAGIKAKHFIVRHVEDSSKDDTPVTALENLEISEPTTTTFKIDDWYQEGVNNNWTETWEHQTIETAHLKGKKLTVAGDIEWCDQGSGNQKGTFRLRLFRDGNVVEGSAQ